MCKNRDICSRSSLKKSLLRGRGGARIREGRNMNYTVQRRRAQWLISWIPLPPPPPLPLLLQRSFFRRKKENNDYNF